MPNIPTLSPAEIIDCDPPCPEMDGYAVIALWKGRCKLFPTLWDSEEVAKHEAERLPPGWIHRKVIHLQWKAE